MKKVKKLEKMFFRSGCSRLAASGMMATVLGVSAATAHAHGFVGDRFFPPTIATDDPFATDELMLPSVSYIKSQGVETTDIGFRFDKEILPKFAIGVAGDWLNLKPEGQPAVNGFDNLTDR